MPIQSGVPVGSLERIKELGRSPAEWGTCSAPGTHENIGCYQYARCQWRYGRPRNFGVLVAKPTSSGTGSRMVVMPCFAQISASDRLRANGGVAKIIAQEGEEIRVRGTVFAYPNSPASIVQREITKDDPGGVVRVPAFPDPGDRADLSSARYLEELLIEAKRDEVTALESAMIGERLVQALDGESDGGDEAASSDEGADRKGARRRAKGDGVA